MNFTKSEYLKFITSRHWTLAAVFPLCFLHRSCSANLNSKMSKNTITAFFSKKIDESILPKNVNVHNDLHEEECPPAKIPRVEITTTDDISMERDPGLRRMIWEYPLEKREDIIRSYLNMGPYQYIMADYPYSNSGKQRRRFQASWFKQYF